MLTDGEIFARLSAKQFLLQRSLDMTSGQTPEGKLRNQGNIKRARPKLNITKKKSRFDANPLSEKIGVPRRLRLDTEGWHGMQDERNRTVPSDKKRQFCVKAYPHRIFGWKKA